MTGPVSEAAIQGVKNGDATEWTAARAPLLDGLPSFGTRAFAAARASFVPREIASRSGSVTRAMIRTVNSLA